MKRFSTKTKVTLIATSLFLVSLVIVSSIQLLYVKLFLVVVVASLIWYAVGRWFDPLRATLWEAGLHRAQLMAKLAHVVTGPGGSFESWSDTLPELIGVEAAQVPRSTREWLDILHPEDRPLFRGKAIEADKAHGRTEVGYRLRRGDGAWIHVRQTMEPLTGEHGAELRWFNTIQDVTEQREAEAELRDSESLKGAILESSLDCLVTIDHEGKIVEFNPAAEATFGFSRDQALGKSMVDLIVPPRLREAHRRGFAHYLATGEGPILGKRLELQAVRADGTEFPIELAIVAIKSRSTPLFTAFLRDITQRKQAEAKIQRLTRVHAVLSGINAAIVRIRDRHELFQEACRIAVEDGGFLMVWIGIVDREAEVVKPVASAGDVRDFFHAAPLAVIENKSGGHGLAGRAIRAMKPMISNDVESDPQRLMRRELNERGIQSVAVIPLIVGEEAVGVLALYAAEVGAFDDEEMRLLLELAGDVAFALEHIDKAEKIDYLSYYDSLTGLANRTLFHERLEQSILNSAQERRTLGLVLFDIERFKSINDSLGRQAGDALLKQIAGRMTQYSASAARAARIGADQFAQLVPDMQADEFPRFIEKRLGEIFGEPFRVNDTELRISARVGIAIYPDNGADADTLFRNAEAALKKAKATGERYMFYEQAMTARFAEKLTLENKLRQALENEEFVLHYQPKVELEARKIVGVEALIRWQSTELGLVPPMKFIPLLEETGLILQVGSWALRRAAFDHRTWVEQGLKPPRVAVNVSPIQLRQRDFVRMVEQAIMEGVAPTGIDLEITESLIMEDIRANIEKLILLRKLGIQVAIDDFGTGYSSLSYLARLPVETLKIDRSFVITMLEDPNTTTLVQTMITLAHSFRLKVVAEGVDSEDQAKILRLLGCDQMQGYLFSKPLPVEALIPLLRKGLDGNGPAGAAPLTS
ncbi:MAG TPA: EAL domain-containing protein [Burkholderiales bacterium]|nr:EAL domain-containing protein [Burkholderiales bacterium]